jgi:hypothetical protein
MPKLYYYHSGLIKKSSKKNPIKMVGSKSTYPKWHFGQVGHGAKKPYGGFFGPKFLVKKIKISSGEMFVSMASTFMQPWEAINIVAQIFCQWFNPFGSNK